MKENLTKNERYVALTKLIEKYDRLNSEVEDTFKEFSNIYDLDEFVASLDSRVASNEKTLKHFKSNIVSLWMEIGELEGKAEKTSEEANLIVDKKMQCLYYDNSISDLKLMNNKLNSLKEAKANLEKFVEENNFDKKQVEEELKSIEENMEEEQIVM